MKLDDDACRRLGNIFGDSLVDQIRNEEYLRDRGLVEDDGTLYNLRRAMELRVGDNNV